MKHLKKMAVVLAVLLAAATLFTACDGLSAETADALLTVAGDVLTEYASQAETDEASTETAYTDGESATDTETEETPAQEETVTETAVEEVAESAEESSAQQEPAQETEQEQTASVVYGTAYLDKDSVAEYLHIYGELPPNYLTKKEAQSLGWVSSEGNLWEVTDHGSIGGDYFGNYENKLPTAKGRKFYECDVNFDGGYRGSDRLIYTNDGLIYYTGDHYNTFTLLYGEE